MKTKAAGIINLIWVISFLGLGIWSIANKHLWFAFGAFLIGVVITPLVEIENEGMIHPDNCKIIKK